MRKVSWLTLVFLLIGSMQILATDKTPYLSPSLLIPSPRNDTDHTINALFSERKMVSTGNLWDRIRDGFEIPELNREQVAIYERYYAQHPEYINRIVSRGTRYLYHVVSEIQKRGLPMELALLPIVESAYNPRAESPAKASGIWQFIPATGKMYGLERTWWYDGRRDIVMATNAALNYLQKLYEIFGDWTLALAAYNWGDGSVKRAQAKNIARGLPTDYTAINMPAETRNYVPKLIAIRNIIANPRAFGVKLALIADKPYFTILNPQRHIDVKVAAKLAEVSVEELLQLNPGYIRPVIAYKKNRHLVLPINNAEIFKKNLASYNRPLLNWQPYTTKRGESLRQIAAEFGITIEELRLVNSIAANSVTARGQTVLVPIQHHIDNEDKSALTAVAINREGSLIDANQPEATPDVIFNLVMSLEKKGADSVNNHIDPALSEEKSNTQIHPIKNFHLFEKNPLTDKIAAAKKAPMAAPKVQHYEVKSGETLYRIAKNLNVPIEALAKANRLHNNQIQAGQLLIIPAINTL